MNTLVIIIFFIDISFSQGNPSAKFLEGIDTGIKNPFNLRDPFKRKLKLKLQRIQQFERSDWNTLSKKDLLNIPLNALKIEGIIFGPKRRAIAKIDGQKKTFILKEGMIIGKNNQKIEAILPSGIVIVEKTVNIYDQEEFLETIIPISKKDLSFEKIENR